ncbi:MAG: hypothetical protein QM786_00335 [Breznakibacter sp.]
MSTSKERILFLKDKTETWFKAPSLGGIWEKLIFILVLPLSANAQQLDQIGKSNPFQLSGGVGVNQVYKDPVSTGDNPYSVVVNGNLTANVYGMSIPVSFAWSNYQWTYTQPFNQFSLSPSYKWATLHMGYSSMSFSPYSLNGHSFAGVGVELSPGDKFKFSAMHGRLLKATPGDSVHGIDPQYKRMGTGAMAQYKFTKGEVALHLFHAADNLEKPVPYIDSLGIAPRENLATGVKLSLMPWSSVRISIDYGLSLMSNDRRLARATDLDPSAGFSHSAIKTDVTYSQRLGSIGVGVEYVEPGYNTLGSYYMVNDFVNYTLNLATSVAKGKVNVSAMVGLRENNLSGQNADSQKDLINNLAIGFNPSEALSFNATYSNFYNYTYIRTAFDEVEAHTGYELLDTLKFTQINENVNVGATWRFRQTETANHTLTANLNAQQATQSQSDVPGNSGSTFLNASGGYQWGRPKNGFSMGINVMVSQNKADTVTSNTWGPVWFVRKSMFDKKLQTGANLSWNASQTNGLRMGESFTCRGNVGYTLKKSHQFSFSVAYTQRHSPTKNSTGFTAMLGYNWSLSNPSRKGADRHTDQ